MRLSAEGVWQLLKGSECPRSHGNALLSAYCVPVKVALRAGLLQNRGPFFMEFTLPSRVFISRAKPGGPGTARVRVGREPGRKGAEEGALLPAGRRPRPAGPPAPES